MGSEHEQGPPFDPGYMKHKYAERYTGWRVSTDKWLIIEMILFINFYFFVSLAEGEGNVFVAIGDE